MQRRNFIKLSLVTCASLALPQISQAATDYSKISFNRATFEENSPQVLIVFLYGGASQLCGNLTNISTIQAKSQSSYNSYFRSITPTVNNFWQEAGGLHMEEMIADADMSIFRTCYSEVRESENNKSHAICTTQNQLGSFDETEAGIITNLSAILSKEGVVDENSVMPFVTMEGSSSFYASGDAVIQSYLKPVGLDENFNNPYERYVRYWYQYTEEERTHDGYNKNDSTGFDPAFNTKMNEMAQKNNTNLKIKDAFEKRAPLSDFIDNISNKSTPDLGSSAYSKNNTFATKIEAAIKILANNPDTKVVTLNTGGLGGWDDHNEAQNYVTRSEELFSTLKSSMAHLKALNKEQNISIMVFGEFGRNVNLNSALGWDHGNLQNLYVLGGKKYFNHKGVVGETVVDDPGSINRLYMKPKEGSYAFEPLSIAATLYKIFGITNPEVLTDGNSAINL